MASKILTINKNSSVLVSKETVSEYSFDENTDLITEFNNILISKKITEGNYKLLLELFDKSTNKKIDQCDINFDYNPILINPSSKVDFVGNTFDFNLISSTGLLVNNVKWQVDEPDDNVVTDSDGVFSSGKLQTKGTTSIIKKYKVSASYIDQDNIKRISNSVTISILPSIVPDCNTFISNTAQSFQFKLGTNILDDPATHLTWSWLPIHGNGSGFINMSPQDGILSFAANTNAKVCVTATLAKGTKITEDEILENNITANADVTIFDIFIDPNNAIVDKNKKSPFKLTWRLLSPSDITNLAEWNTNNGNIAVTSNVAELSPTAPGTATIKAILKKGTDLLPNSPDSKMIVYSDVELISNVKVAEIKIADALPLTARIEPVNAIGIPITSYRRIKEFTVSVDGAKVDINLPTITEGAGHGTIEHISSSNPDLLPILHKYRFTPPPAFASSPYHFYSDDTVHVEVKSPQFSEPSISDKLVIYRPIKQNLTLKHLSGQKSGVGDFIAYSTGERVCVHGFFETFRDDVGNTLERSGNFKLGENTGLHYYYEANSILGGWYNYYDPIFLNGSATGYAYTTNWSGPITQTIVYNLTRSSIAVPYTYSVVSTRITSGWAPPDDTLPPRVIISAPKE